MKRIKQPITRNKIKDKKEQSIGTYFMTHKDNIHYYSHAFENQSTFFKILLNHDYFTFFTYSFR